jgi:hypothetical protein
MKLKIVTALSLLSVAYAQTKTTVQAVFSDEDCSSPLFIQVNPIVASICKTYTNVCDHKMKLSCNDKPVSAIPKIVETGKWVQIANFNEDKCNGNASASTYVKVDTCLTVLGDEESPFKFTCGDDGIAAKHVCDLGCVHCTKVREASSGSCDTSRNEVRTCLVNGKGYVVDRSSDGNSSTKSASNGANTIFADFLVLLTVVAGAFFAL